MSNIAAVPDDRLFTAAEAAEVLGLSIATLYKMMNRGELNYIMIGSSRRIRRSVVMHLIDASEKRGPREDWISPHRRQAED